MPSRLFSSFLICAWMVAAVQVVAQQPQQKTINVPDRRVGDGTRLPDSIGGGTLIGLAPRGILVRDVGQQRLVVIDRGTTIQVTGAADASVLKANSPVSFRAVLDGTRSVLQTDAITVYRVVTKRPTVTGNNMLSNRANESMQKFLVVNDQNQIVNEGATVNGKIVSSNPLVVSVRRQTFPVQLAEGARVTLTCLVDDFSLCSEGDRVAVNFRTVRSHDSAIADFVNVTRATPFSAIPDAPAPEKGRDARR